MTDTPQYEAESAWNLSVDEWAALLTQAQAKRDALEDGAFARAEPVPGTAAMELVFYATALNKPDRWAYPFLEIIAGAQARGAVIGRAWHETDTGFVQFEVTLIAAAQELAADYESGASDLDWVTYEQAVTAAVGGTPADAAWLRREFARLRRVARL